MTTTNYIINIASTYQQTFSPIEFMVGYKNIKIEHNNYQCISLIQPSHYVIHPLNNDLQVIQNNILQASKEGSYSVQLFNMNNSITDAIIYSFYIFEKPFIMNQDIILRLINKELPNIYNASNKLNMIDNYASAGVINKLYNYVYELFYNAITSIGTTINGLSGYNNNWETVYIEVTNFLQNAAYPAKFLNTLININTQCSVQRFSIAITLSRLCYQFLNTYTPVYIVYVPSTNIYLITIYYSDNNAWILGDNIYSVLGETTILANSNLKSFLWIIQTIANRLIPASIKFMIQYEQISIFNSNFNISAVNTGIDFIDTTIIYDAYMVVNNNNVFNTQGYFLNS